MEILGHPTAFPRPALFSPTDACEEVALAEAGRLVLIFIRTTPRKKLTTPGLHGTTLIHVHMLHFVKAHEL